MLFEKRKYFSFFAKKDLYSIRDVIAFPKVQNAGEPMSGAPDVVDEQQLKDLSIALTLKD